MERLTERDKQGYITTCFWETNTENGMYDLDLQLAEDMIVRLAAYEDTGLEPEEIEVLQAHVDGLTELFVNTSCGGAVSYTRLAELAQAEKDGRVVVLPVPVGAGKIAYGLTDPGDGPQRIVTIECDYLEKLEIWDNPGHEVVVEVNGWEIGESDIGKTVFLTREEAEAALKKRKDEDEND